MAFSLKNSAAKFVEQSQSEMGKALTQGTSSGVKAAAMGAMVTVGEGLAQTAVKLLGQGASQRLDAKIASNPILSALGGSLVDGVLKILTDGANARVKSAGNRARGAIQDITGVAPPGYKDPYAGVKGQVIQRRTFTPQAGTGPVAGGPDLSAALPGTPSAGATAQRGFLRNLYGNAFGMGNSLSGGAVGAGVSLFATEHSLGAVTSSLSTALQTTIQLTETMGALQRNIGNTGTSPKAFMGRVLGSGNDLGMLPQDAASAASLFLPSARNGTARDIFQQMHYASAFGMNSDQWSSSMAQAAGVGLVGGAKGSMSTPQYQAMLAQSFVGTSGIAKMGDYAAGYQDFARIIAANTVKTPNANNTLQLYSAFNKTGIAGLSGTSGAAVLGQLSQGITNAPNASAGVQTAYYQALSKVIPGGVSPSLLKYITEGGLAGADIPTGHGKPRHIDTFKALVDYSNQAYKGYNPMDKLYAQSQLMGMGMMQTQAVLGAYGNGNNGFKMAGLTNLLKGAGTDVNHVNASQMGLLTQLASGKYTKQVAAEMTQQNVSGIGNFLHGHKSYNSQQLADLLIHGGTPQTADVAARGAANAVQKPLQQFAQWVGEAAIAAKDFLGPMTLLAGPAALVGLRAAGKRIASRFGPKESGDDSATAPDAARAGKAVEPLSGVRRALAAAGDYMPAFGAAAGFMDMQSHQEAAYNLTQTSLAHLPASVRKMVQAGKLTSYYNPKTHSFELAHTGKQAKGYYQLQSNPMDNGYGVRSPLYRPPGWQNMSHLPQVPYGDWFGDTTNGWNPRMFSNGILGLGGQTYLQPGLAGKDSKGYVGGGVGLSPAMLQKEKNASDSYVTNLGTAFSKHLKAAGDATVDVTSKTLNVHAPLPNRTMRLLQDDLSKFITDFGSGLTTWMQAALSAAGGTISGLPGGTSGGSGGSGGSLGGYIFTKGGKGTISPLSGSFSLNQGYGAHDKEEPSGYQYADGTIGYAPYKPGVGAGKYYSHLHNGIDLGAPMGTAIRAGYTGKINEKWDKSGFGNELTLDNGKNTELFGHLSRYAVKNGAVVKQGQIIGYTGSTGNSTGPHLHFSVIDDKTGDFIDPTGYYNGTAGTGITAAMAARGGVGGGGITVPAGLPPQYKAMYQAAAAKYGNKVPWQLLAAEGYKESRWNPGIVSGDGGYGIAQFTGATGAQYLGGTGWQQRAKNPALAIPAQAAYMNYLMSQENGSLWAATRDYNGSGPKAAQYATSLVGPPTGVGGGGAGVPNGGSFEATIQLIYPNGMKQNAQVTFHPKHAGIPYTHEGHAAAAMGGRAPKR